MALLKSSYEQSTKMYQQLLNLLEEMSIQAGEISADEEGADESGLIQSLAEDAEERGLDGEVVGRIMKQVSMLRRKAREE